MRPRRASCNPPCRPVVEHSPVAHIHASFTRYDGVSSKHTSLACAENPRKMLLLRYLLQKRKISMRLYFLPMSIQHLICFEPRGVLRFPGSD